ncbi:probable ATP dependent DNA/RNA helicase [Psychrobacter arcticus 273-4]|uniref:Probable ATP dependent DNA/RNA helicase n=1 Tax=Psychrobacter arcticus (strain DSM 17307 / VKM B-2377 / 273-4) TaxID=259536 RepID=Q4FSV6_PSYA2|nr:ATP-dependent RNA helicase HrpA [Psychrobacter arcticus]AAZ18902.1 probable ATP dependent DNA/RNA helicase [Psychrobacter arcticus 273-4]
MPDILRDNQESNQHVQAENLNVNVNTKQQENTKPQNAVSFERLPVLAKDEYHLSRLERELARAKSSKKPAANQNTNTDDKHDAKNSNDLDKKRAQYEQLKTRSQQAVQARIDSMPNKLAEKLNLDLPVSQRADDLIQAIIDNQVIIVAGETGSGKTTQLPKLAMLAGRGIRGQIGHTQPRRLAARSVANRIAEELGEQLGNTVSFKIRFNEQGTAQSVVKLMTDGILLAELGHDRFLSKYDTIIIDEAHERSLNIDFIMGYLKKLLPKRPDLKVIITSATLDTKRFSEYFSRYDNKLKRNIPAPIFNVEGRSFPVEVRYRPLTDEPVTSSDDDSYDDFEENLPRAVVAAVEECFSDAQNKGHADQADILIFAATEAEIRELQEVLERHGPKHTEVLPLFARQTYEEQQRIFQPSGRGRRIVIATNVAETALTVPGIRYVIDLGFARISRYSYRSRVQRLPIEAISQAAANQRKGRCGRVAPGVCIRLYSDEDFTGRLEFTEPEILRTNLASVILQMANLRLGSVDDFEFIEPPDSRLVTDGHKLLNELGAIVEKDEQAVSNVSNKSKRQGLDHLKLTRIGQQMARMPIDPRLARMLVAGSDFDCIREMLIVVAALAVQDPRERPANKRTQADQKHAEFRQDDSDFLFYLSLWKALFEKDEDGNKLSGNQRKQFTKKNYLSFPRVREWQQTHRQLVQMVTELKLNDDAINPKSNTENAELANSDPTGVDDEALKAVKYANLHRALLTGLLSIIAHKTENRGEYLAARQQKAKIFPASTVFKQIPPWVMAFEMVETSQVFMRTVAKIEPEWIISAAGNLLKYHYFEPHWSKKTGRVKAYAQISLFGLIIISKQLTNYEQVNLSESREIFIRDGLVTGNLGRQAPFLQHNMDKIADIERIEDKLRRRDLLVDEESLYQFYDKKIPEHIASRKTFEDWRVEVERTDTQYLFFTDEDVLNSQAPTTGDFPEIWKLGDLKLPLRYIFDPASDDDGVTIRVPLVALPQLDAIELLWGVPGWRFELVLQLLKSLPKDIRRQIVPIPDTADSLFDELQPAGGQGLLKQLCQALNRRGIMSVTPEHFNPSSIDRYLQPQICVVDDKNRIIEKGRDLQTLQIRHASQTRQAVNEQQGAHTEFPEHFAFSKNHHSAGVVMKQFAALVTDEAGEAVSIHQYTDVNAALQAHRIGVLTLIKSKLGSKKKQLTSQVDNIFKLAFAPLGDMEKLKTIIIDATLDAALEEHYVLFDHTADIPESADDIAVGLSEELPFTPEEYSQTLDVVLSNFLLIGQTIIKTLKNVYTRWQRIRQSLLMLDREIFGESIEDIEDQLGDLHLADFVYRMDYSHWQQYPRYLEALEIRIDRLEHNIEADLDGVYALDLHMERLAGRANDKAISDYRWMVEEYRIQLFAQPMKTRMAVSPKRLSKIWDKMS